MPQQHWGAKKHVDVILAVGGGSVIDSSKIISITIPVSHSGWDFIKTKLSPKQQSTGHCVNPAATGTEMNRFAVVQNKQNQRKLGYGDPLTYPKESFLDPTYTIVSACKLYLLWDHRPDCSLPGSYFGEGEASLSDRFVYAIIREAIDNGPHLIHDLRNYVLREKIMYAATTPSII